MNIYAFIPLVATIAYIPLLVTTASVRPWSRQHKLFFVFLVAASLWSLDDYLLRSQYFPQLNYLLFQIVIVMFTWMPVQHRRWLKKL